MTRFLFQFHWQRVKRSFRCQTYINRHARIRDAPPTSPALPTEDVRTIMLSKISWGAVLAGVVLALAPKSCSTCSDRHWGGDARPCYGR